MYLSKRKSRRCRTVQFSPKSSEKLLRWVVRQISHSNRAGFTTVELVVAVALVGLLTTLFVFPLSAWANGAATQAKQAECDALNSAAMQYMSLLDRGATRVTGWDTEAGAITNLTGAVSLRGQMIQLLPTTSLSSPSGTNGLVYVPSAESWKPGSFTTGSN